jgi:hypothetical protein
MVGTRDSLTQKQQGACRHTPRSHTPQVWTPQPWRVSALDEGTKAMTAHENTAGHTSSAANGSFIAYMLGLVLLAGCMLKMLVGKYVHR